MLHSGARRCGRLVALSVVLVQPRTGAGTRNALLRLKLLPGGSATGTKECHRLDRLGVALQAVAYSTNEKKTENAYRRAVELDPQFPVAYAHLARVLNRMGRRDEAQPLYERATQLAKDPAS